MEELIGKVKFFLIGDNTVCAAKVMAMFFPDESFRNIECLMSDGSKRFLDMLYDTPQEAIKPLVVVTTTSDGHVASSDF